MDFLQTEDLLSHQNDYIGHLLSHKTPYNLWLQHIPNNFHLSYKEMDRQSNIYLT